MALVQERGIGRRDVRRLGAPWRTSSEGHVFRLSGLTRSFGGRDTKARGPMTRSIASQPCVENDEASGKRRPCS